MERKRGVSGEQENRINQNASALLIVTALCSAALKPFVPELKLFPTVHGNPLVTYLPLFETHKAIPQLLSLRGVTFAGHREKLEQQHRALDGTSH